MIMRMPILVLGYSGKEALEGPCPRPIRTCGSVHKVQCPVGSSSFDPLVRAAYREGGRRVVDQTPCITGETHNVQHARVIIKEPLVLMAQ